MVAFRTDRYGKCRSPSKDVSAFWHTSNSSSLEQCRSASRLPEILLPLSTRIRRSGSGESCGSRVRPSIFTSSRTCDAGPRINSSRPPLRPSSARSAKPGARRPSRGGSGARLTLGVGRRRPRRLAFPSQSFWQTAAPQVRTSVLLEARRAFPGERSTKLQGLSSEASRPLLWPAPGPRVSPLPFERPFSPIVTIFDSTSSADICALWADRRLLTSCAKSQVQSRHALLRRSSADMRSDSSASLPRSRHVRDCASAVARPRRSHARRSAVSTSAERASSAPMSRSSCCSRALLRTAVANASSTSILRRSASALVRSASSSMRRSSSRTWRACWSSRRMALASWR
mmetsp:Transcript_101213/g.241339  ORF Transcript_101213/g.241339 Transcript_101213/m.241339 type:complete len:344 (+) Transcript_101213:722-1753(+)